MRFGIYCEIQTPPGKPHYDMTWEIMRQIEHADECGFDVYSVIDHHFFQKFSISANPLAMFAAAAQRTKRIRFRTALHTLPLENPMRLAGMIAETDILTNGRLECGLGRGHAWLFGPSSLPLEESRPRYNEAIDILELAFTKEKFSYDGEYYKVKDVTVVPRPVQKPHPKFYTGGTSDITYQMAAKRVGVCLCHRCCLGMCWKLHSTFIRKRAPPMGTSRILSTSARFISMKTKIRSGARSNRRCIISWRSTPRRSSHFRVKRRKPSCGLRATASMPAALLSR